VQISDATKILEDAHHAFPDVKSTKSGDLFIVWSGGKTSTMNLFMGKLVIH
jgi:hypothetical protein